MKIVEALRAKRRASLIVVRKGKCAQRVTDADASAS